TTIIVHQGEYRERLLIGKGITLKAAPGENFELSGGDLTRGPPGTRGTMVTIASDTKVTIDGGNFSYEGDTWDDAAIKIQYGDNHEVMNANFSNSKQGIWVHGNDHDDNSTIQVIDIHHNTFTNITGHAIYLQGTWGNVENNYINDSCDGIMVAFGWIAPNPYVGSISENIIENCSVGVNMVGSTVFNYEDNEITGCGVGELLNDTQQESVGNTFEDCQVGTRVINGSSPKLLENTYTDCPTPVLIDRCTGLKAYENEITGTDIGFQPVYSKVEHLDHDIASNNTIDGRPVFYSFGDNEAAHVLQDFGQVFIANSSYSSYSIRNPSPVRTVIAYSTGVDIGGSKLTTGLDLFRSDLSGEGATIGDPGLLTTPLRMDDSDLKIYNSTIKAVDELEESAVLDTGSNLNLYNSTYGAMAQFHDAASRIRFFSYIGLKVLHQDGGLPVEGAHYEFSVDDTRVHASSLFEGSDPETNPDGFAGPFWIRFGTMTRSADTVHEVTVTVNATADRSFEGSRFIDYVEATESHTEEFVIGDILRPMAPKNLQADIVVDGDANRLTWDKNTDDAVLYRIYYLDDGNWSMVGEATGTTFDHPGLPSGTLASYRVTAVDEVGLESLPSTSVEVESVDQLAPAPPREVRISNVTTQSLTLSWKRSASNDVVEYEVHLVERSQGGELTSRKLIRKTSDLSVMVQDMSDSKNLFAVKAVDEVGLKSMFSSPASIEADDLTWPEISDLEWTIGAHSARVGWKTNEPTTSWLWIGTSVEDVSSIGPGPLGTEHLFEVEDLLAETTYYFYIHAVEPSGNDVIDDNQGQFYSFTTYESEGYLRLTILDQDEEKVTGIDVKAAGDSLSMKVLETEPGIYMAYLIPGSWNVTITSTDHEPLDPFEVVILPDQWNNMTVHLSSLFWEEVNLTIRVLDDQGNVIAGAVIEYDGREYTTGSDGRVSLGKVGTNRTIHLTISAEGYETLEKDIFIPSKNREQKVDVSLIPGGEEEDDGFMTWLIILAAVVGLLLLLFVLFVVLSRRSRKEPAEEEEEPEDEEEALEEEEKPAGAVKKGKVKKEEEPSGDKEEKEKDTGEKKEE
ncbi:MAG: fibronectin type III domain-containing protein, partial [Thermoplasmatota archaeon]